MTQSSTKIIMLLLCFLSLNIKANASQIKKEDFETIKKLDSIDFSVTIIGSGNPQYNPERSQPSALVQYKGVKFLVDMGNGTMTNLEKLGFTAKNSPDALFLTHNHIDHNAEFIPMVHSKLMLPTTFLIAGPSPIDEMTNYTKKFYKEDLNYRMKNKGKTFDENNTNETVKVLNGGESFEYKGVRISTIEVPHSIKAIAYRFDVDGKSIVITGDLSYSTTLQKLAKNVDVLVIDGKISANNNPNTSAKESGAAHASIEEIAKMAIESNAKTMVLTHLGNQSVNPEVVYKLYADLGFKGKVIVAADFLTITPEGNSFMLEASTNSSSHKNTRIK